MATSEAGAPRSVRKGPLITVKCECGERRDLRYGEQWRCEGCGRRYDTRKIPIEEYAAIRRAQIRYRMFPLLAGVLLLLAVVLVLGRRQSVQRGGRGHVPARLLGCFRTPFFAPATGGVQQEPPTWEIKGDSPTPLPARVRADLRRGAGHGGPQCTISTSQWTLCATDSVTL